MCIPTLRGTLDSGRKRARLRRRRAAAAAAIQPFGFVPGEAETREPGIARPVLPLEMKRLCMCYARWPPARSSWAVPRRTINLMEALRGSLAADRKAEDRQTL
jgi:hypothetical protein